MYLNESISFPSVEGHLYNKIPVQNFVNITLGKVKVF